MHKLLRATVVVFAVIILLTGVTFAASTLKLYTGDVYVAGTGDSTANRVTLQAGQSAMVAVEVNARKGNIPGGIGYYDINEARLDVGNYTINPGTPVAVVRTVNQYVYFPGRNFETEPMIVQWPVTVTVAAGVPAGLYEVRVELEHGSHISLEDTRITGGKGKPAMSPFTAPKIYVRVADSSYSPSPPNGDAGFWRPPLSNEKYVLKNGSTLPIKFKLAATGTVALTVSGPGGFSYTWTADKGRNALRYDAAEGNYIANFHTRDFNLAKGEYTVSVYDGPILVASKTFSVVSKPSRGKAFGLLKKLR